MAWLQRLGRGEGLEHYFTDLQGFPVVSLPHWVAETLHTRVHQPFHSDLDVSTIHGYLYIRLIDDFMDEATVGSELLLATGFLHSQFERVYRSYFEPTHSFWSEFDRHWFGCHEATLVDSRFETVDLTAFTKIAGRKTSAAKIPMIATCHYYSRADL